MTPEERPADLPPPGDDEGPEPAPDPRRTRWLFARVLIVQLVTLIALWALQSAFGAG